MIDIMQGINHIIFLLILLDYDQPHPECRWEMHDCGDVDVSCSGRSESVRLDAKNELLTGQCFAIKTKSYGNFKNYEVKVDMQNVDSADGVSQGHLGI